MSGYSFMNLIGIIMLVTVAVLLRTRKKILRVFKLSLLAPPLTFPWLYFGISQRAWAHADPGPLFMNVPLNELCLTFIMTFVGAGVFTLNFEAIIHEARRSAETKDGTTQKE